MAERYASVTALTGLLPKNLTWWAGNSVADCALNHRDEWEHLPPDEQYEYVRRAHQRIKRSAADLGSEVHRFVEAQNLGKPTPAWPLPVRARMTHFARFVADHDVTVEAAETKVYHRGDRGGSAAGLRYAGTADMFAAVDGEMACIDVKTGSRVWPEAALQINAYSHADFLIADPNHPGARQITPARGKRWYEWHGPAADELPVPEVTRGYVLHLRDDGYTLVRVPICRELYDMFLSLFAVDRWEREVKGRVLHAVAEDRAALAEQAILEFGDRR